MANEYTDQRADWFGVEKQREGEDDSAYRNRVANELRKQGHIIEAHEAYNNALYDQSDAAMAGIAGALAQAMQRTNYGGDQIGNDIAAGVVATSKEPKPDLGMLMMAILLSSK